MSNSADSAFREDAPIPFRAVRDSAIASLRGSGFGRPESPGSVTVHSDSSHQGDVQFDAGEVGPEVTCADCSLSEAIENRLVKDTPPLMTWAQWQVWRRDVGFRPKEPARMRSAFRLRCGKVFFTVNSWIGSMASNGDASWNCLKDLKRVRSPPEEALAQCVKSQAREGYNGEALLSRFDRLPRVGLSAKAGLQGSATRRGSPRLSEPFRAAARIAITKGLGLW